MKRITTTPYHPQANGVIERLNATVLNLLRILGQNNVGIWDTILSIATFLIIVHFIEVSGPLYLMYLRDPCFPLEMIKEEKT